MIVEGEGAYTTVDGAKCPMSRGDLILTPTGLWHEHGHDGDQPVVWLDVLDLPLIYYMETSYVTEGKAQLVSGEAAEQAYQRGGVVPAPMFNRAGQPFPMLRYPWVDVRKSLEALAASQPNLDAIQVAYVNPETGADCQKILGFSALMLRPGERLAMPARSSAMVFHQVEGAADVTLEGHQFSLSGADTCCIPGYTPLTISNRSTDLPAFVFIADDAPLQKKLGVYEVRN